MALTEGTPSHPKGKPTGLGGRGIKPDIDGKMDKLHFRVLVLDDDAEKSRCLEKNFLSTYIEGSYQYNFEDTYFYFVSGETQLASVPDIMTFNSVWINMNFPNWNAIAQDFYLKNPFCYQILYGKAIPLSSALLRSRPVGYLRDVGRSEDVHEEMRFISRYFPTEKNMLHLRARGSSFWVPYDNIIYLQSKGRKTFIHLNAKGVMDGCMEDDIFVKRADSADELFAYVQNCKLDDLYAGMDPSVFIRVHKSYLVNRAYVRGIEKTKYSWMLSLEDRTGNIIKIPVSDPYHKPVSGIFAFS